MIPERKLSDFIQDGKPPDYINARKIINGLDQAQTIATYVSAFELCIKSCKAFVRHAVNCNHATVAPWCT